MSDSGDIITTTNNLEKAEVVLEGLYYVDDPEVGLNVVDLGLVYHLDFDEEAKRLDLTLTFTTQFCPMGDTILENVTNSVTESIPDWDLNIDLTFEPPWDQSKISDVGKELLGQW